MRRLLFASLALLLMAAEPASSSIETQEEDVRESINALHTKQGPAKSYTVWGECGKRLKGEKAQGRASEYAQAIVASANAVEVRTGEVINLDYMVAILFQESSHDECVIGKQETKKLTAQLGREPNREEVIEHVRVWAQVYARAKKKCRESGYGSDIKCIGNNLGKEHQEYRGIHGWDLGAAQYRFPGYKVRRRSVVLPSGKIIDRVGLRDLFDYEISIQMLAEDLAHYREICQGHEHWERSRWGRKLRKLDPEEAYFVHHHTGDTSWSHRYWRQINKHLKKIRETKASSLVATLGHDVI